MAISTDDINRITREVTNGETPSIPDSKEAREFRSVVAKEIEQIRKDGFIVDVPFEWPEA